ncbi:MAG: vWA domain-containing protein [Flavobacteriales bacterium]
MRWLYLFFVLMVTGEVFAQENLVINPGMEDSVKRDAIHMYNTSLRVGHPLAPGWVTPTRSTSDFYNSHESTIKGSPIVVAHRGSGRIGFIAGAKTRSTGQLYKEYAMGKLSRPLEANKNYCVRFYIALDGSCKYANDSIGVYFSTQPMREENSYTLQNLRPHIVMPPDSFIVSKDGWVEVSGYYPASGGEQYITIGCFSNKDRVKLKSIGERRTERFHFSKIKKYAYYYMDDVSVTELPDSATGPCSTPSVKIVSNSERFLFLVDISGSMHAHGVMDSLKNALNAAVQKLPPNTEISVVTFSGTPQMVVPFIEAQYARFPGNALDTIKGGGGTNVSHSIEFAYNYLAQEGKRNGTSILLFTDGIFEVPLPSQRRIQQNYKDHGIRFSSMLIGNRPNFDLQKLATSTSANYSNVTTESIDEQISKEVYKEVPVANKEKTYYTKPYWALIAIRPLKYWLFIGIGYLLIRQYT